MNQKVYRHNSAPPQDIGLAMLQLWKAKNKLEERIRALEAICETTEGITIDRIVDFMNNISAIRAEQGEPTGFTATGVSNTTLAFVDNTRVFTITGNHDIWIEGKIYSKGTGSTTLTDSTGIHFIYYDSDGDLTSATSWPGYDVVLVASVYYNTAAGFDKGLLADERHGITMDGATHEYLHDTVGTRYESGLAGTFDDTTLSITAGVIHDEDLEISIDAQTDCTILYKNGDANYQWDLDSATPYKLNGANLRYNNGNNLADVPSNQYVAYWIFATNDTSGPIVSLMGQRIDTTLAAARENNKYENLTLATLPYKEMKLMYRVIYRNDATPYEETEDLRAVSNISAGTYSPLSHNALTDLEWSNAGHSMDTTLNMASNAIDDVTTLSADKVDADSVSGLSITDDGNNLGVFISDGGNVGVKTSTLGGAYGLEVNGALLARVASGTPSITAYSVGGSGQPWRLASKTDGKGEVGYNDGSWKTTIGFDGQKAQIAGTSPTATLDVNGSFCLKTTTLTAATNDAVDATGIGVIFIDCTSNSVALGGFTGGVAGQIIHVILKVPSGVYTFTLEDQEGTGNQDIYIGNGGDESWGNVYGGCTLICDGSNWYAKGLYAQT